MQNTHTCCRVPVSPYPGITMHNSYPEVLSADKSQRLHLLFIENSSHDKSFKKQTTYFISSCCFCFGKDLSGLISRDEGTRGDRAGDKKNEQRKWGKGIKVGSNERLMHQNLIWFLSLLGFCHIIRNWHSYTGVDPFAWWMECSLLQSERSIYHRMLMKSSFILEDSQFLFFFYSTPSPSIYHHQWCEVLSLQRVLYSFSAQMGGTHVRIHINTHTVSFC